MTTTRIGKTAKQRIAAAKSEGFGVGCRSEPGEFVPVVDRSRCEAKGACVEICPYDVFEIGSISEADYRNLSWIGRLRVRVHGMQTAYTPRSDLCLACGLCVVACPETAIELVRLSDAG